MAAPPSAPDDDLLRGARILVVDGHPTSGLVVQRKLEAVGADVTFVQEAQRALQMMLEEPDLWDLALVDTHLTGVDGLELVRRIRASELVELPIILLGSMSDPDVRRAAAELSVDAVLARPVRQTELISAAVDGFRRWERANKLVRPPSRPCRVLVVDDDDMNRQIAERILARQGVAVSLASDGQEALEAHQQSPFDAVLMDCRMPVMNGLSATRAIRSLPGAEAAVPIIGWTASPHAGDRERCLDAGMTD